MLETLSTQLRRRLIANYRRTHLSTLAVPFVIQPERLPDGRVVLREQGTTDVRGLVLVAAFSLCVAAALAALLITSAIARTRPAEFWIAVLGAPSMAILGLFLLLLAFTLASAELQVRSTTDERFIEIADVGYGDERVLASGFPEEFRLAVRAITIDEKPIRTWKGWALILSGGQNLHVALACQRSRIDIESWLQSAPNWIQNLPLREEPALRKLGTVKL